MHGRLLTIKARAREKLGTRGIGTVEANELVGNASVTLPNPRTGQPAARWPHCRRPHAHTRALPDRRRG